MSAFPGVFNIIIFTNILYYTCVVNMYSSVHPTFYEENVLYFTLIYNINPLILSFNGMYTFFFNNLQDHIIPMRYINENKNR